MCADFSGVPITTGPLPSWSVPKLTSLILVGDAKSGLGPLPPWSNMPALQTILLSNMHVDGPLPASWTSLTSLASLTLSSLQLSSPVSLPAEWAALSVQTLVLYGCNLVGPLPSGWINGLPNLQQFTVNDVQLSASLVDYANLASAGSRMGPGAKPLSSLRLNWLNLTGTIPSALYASRKWVHAWQGGGEGGEEGRGEGERGEWGVGGALGGEV